MLKIGLTGGIGSGKSTVAAYFKKYGVDVFDADDIARDLVEPGQDALNEIKKLFGDDIVDDNDNLLRKNLGTIVFNDEAARTKLEAILHPRIKKILLDKLVNSHGPYAIAVIPLLVEHNWQDIFDRVVVVDCSEQLQRNRAALRDNMSQDLIDNILRSQIDRSSRLQQATDIITNEGELSDLATQVEKLHNQYLGLANP